jgi:6-phosphofructokinase 1
MIYVDPTYAIRSVAANATDTMLCTTLSKDAVHAAMYGLTDFSVGTIRSTNCLIPVGTMIDGGTNKVSIKSRVWNSLVALND